MKWLGPLKVVYDGPAEAEPSYVSAARVQLGALAAKRLGHFEAPLSSNFTYPDGTTISVMLAGQLATARINVKRIVAKKRVRRFIEGNTAVMCIFPTARPIAVQITQTVAETDTVPAHLVLSTELFYTGDRKVGAVAKGAAGETLLLLFQTKIPSIGDEYTRDGDHFFLSALDDIGTGFPALEDDSQPGRFAVALSCNGVQRYTYSVAEDVGSYNYLDTFGVLNLRCAAGQLPGSSEG